jgi:thioredoxin-like negative regulator of GroEL
MAAHQLATGKAPTIEIAAANCFTNSTYVRAAVTLLKAENQDLQDRVTRGEISLLQAAKQVKRVAALVDAYRRATERDLIQAAKVIGSTFAIAAE